MKHLKENLKQQQLNFLVKIELYWVGILTELSSMLQPFKIIHSVLFVILFFLVDLFTSEGKWEKSKKRANVWLEESWSLLRRIFY